MVVAVYVNLQEVKNYREFLMYERNRREQGTYNKNSSGSSTHTNENICGTLAQLTGQLSAVSYPIIRLTARPTAQ
jgi:hypothetical protein